MPKPFSPDSAPNKIDEVTTPEKSKPKLPSSKQLAEGLVNLTAAAALLLTPVAIGYGLVDTHRQKVYSETVKSDEYRNVYADYANMVKYRWEISSLIRALSSYQKTDRQNPEYIKLNIKKNGLVKKLINLQTSLPKNLEILVQKKVNHTAYEKMLSAIIANEQHGDFESIIPQDKNFGLDAFNTLQKLNAKYILDTNINFNN